MGRLVDIDEVVKVVDRHTKDEPEVILDDDITCILEEVPTAKGDDYNKGLEDAWELAKKLWCPTSYGGMVDEEVIKIFGCDYFAISKLYTPQEALTKLETYEKSKGIKVGDVVESINTGRLGVITRVEKNGKYVMFSDGTSGMFAHDDIRKTNKHIDITSVLEQIKGE